MVKLTQLQESGFSCGKNRCNGSVQVPTLTWNCTSGLEPLLTLLPSQVSGKVIIPENDTPELDLVKEGIIDSSEFVHASRRRNFSPEFTSRINKTQNWIWFNPQKITTKELDKGCPAWSNK